MLQVTLKLLSLADLEGLAFGGAVQGSRFLEGALPPGFVVAAAMENLRAGKEPLWHSFFAFMYDLDGTVAGSGGFKSAPVAGEVEIGYGVAPARQRRGMATAAVRELVRIASADPRVGAVLAKTALANVASRRVVEKAGFIHVGGEDSNEDGPLDIWRFELKSQAESATTASASLP
jgi:RimJ/RimL family protein N-acetyltransferase